jgi:hypothetical protein
MTKKFYVSANKHVANDSVAWRNNTAVSLTFMLLLYYWRLKLKGFLKWILFCESVTQLRIYAIALSVVLWLQIKVSVS